MTGILRKSQMIGILLVGVLAFSAACSSAERFAANFLDINSATNFDRSPLGTCARNRTTSGRGNSKVTFMEYTIRNTEYRING